MKLLTVVSVLLLSALGPRAIASPQYPDHVSINGRSEAMHSYPLEPYLAKHPEKRPTSKIVSSALWRGYVAYFAIIDGKLQVEDIQIRNTMEPKPGEPKMKSVVDEVFPPSTDRTVSWLTGFLILPQGKPTVDRGEAGSTFERYHLLFIKEGRLLADRVFSQEELTDYEQQQFAAFTKSTSYRKLKRQTEEKLKRQTEGRYIPITADLFLSIFDGRFPTEMLIDYKDFRPLSASKQEAAQKE